MISANEKRLQQQIERVREKQCQLETVRASHAELSGEVQSRVEAACKKIGAALIAERGDECRVTVWGLTRAGESRVVRALTEKGFIFQQRYTSAPKYRYGADGELQKTGSWESGSIFIIRW